MKNWNGLGNGLAQALQRLGLHSLQSQLFACLLAPMLLLMVINGLLVHRSSVDIAGPVVEQMLVGSARTIGEDITVEDGYLNVEVPPAALENLKTSARDHVYYRVDAPRQGLISGTEDLPPFKGRLTLEEWSAYDWRVHGLEIRAVAFAQPVYPFGDRDLVIIQVGTTERTRESLARSIWVRAMWPELLLLVAATALGWLWAKAAIAPTSRIGEAVRRREPDSLEALSITGAPTELLPLVESIDGYIERIRHHVEAHDRFISNAAHQLKTPITVLNTQTMVGLRSEDVETKQRALEANYETLQHCIRLIRQLLTLPPASE